MAIASGVSSSEDNRKATGENPGNSKAFQPPTRCEMCDFSLPTLPDRLKHIKETKHCSCDDCDDYIPPGMVYGHYSLKHSDLNWNDHYIATGDIVTLREALPWVREEHKRRTGQDLAALYNWPSDHPEGPSQPQ
jgi:hypothetical protein